jgi:hypothetical protein
MRAIGSIGTILLRKCGTAASTNKIREALQTEAVSPIVKTKIQRELRM